jgi:glycerol-3-phosphate acyltransferase PlsY
MNDERSGRRPFCRLALLLLVEMRGVFACIGHSGPPFNEMKTGNSLSPYPGFTKRNGAGSGSIAVVNGGTAPPAMR